MVSKILSTTALVLLLSGLTLSPHRIQTMEFLFKDPEFSFQCLRAISQSVSGAADIGEVVSTAARISPENPDQIFHLRHTSSPRLFRFVCL